MSEIEGCSNYTIHNEFRRNINSSNSYNQLNSTSCDFRYLREGWHRFTGAAGTIIYTQTPGSCNSCGTRNPGWISHGLYPKNPGQSSTLSMGITWDYYRHNCYGFTEREPVVVRNCGDFYTYKFLSFPSWVNCGFRVCTTF